MLGQIAINHVLEAGGLTQRIAFSQRVRPFIDKAAQLARPLSCGGHAPFRPTPDRHSALTPREAIIHHKGPLARRHDADGKSSDFRVEDLIGPILLRDLLAHGFIVQSQSVDHVHASFCA